MDCRKTLIKAADLFMNPKWISMRSKKRLPKAEAIGEDPQREGLLKTPSRVAQAYEEILMAIASILKS